MHDNFPRTFLSVFVTRLTHYKQTSIVNEMSKKENIYFISSARNQIVRGTVIENRELLDKLFAIIHMDIYKDQPCWHMIKI